MHTRHKRKGHPPCFRLMRVWLPCFCVSRLFPSTTAARLCVLTLQMLGARVTDLLSASITHVLHTQEDAFFTREALEACMAGSVAHTREGQAKTVGDEHSMLIVLCL